MYNNSIIAEKSFQFAIRIIHLYKYLKTEHTEYILSKQVLRSGTSIGAMSKEASQVESKKDFIHKFFFNLFNLFFLNTEQAPMDEIYGKI